MDNCVVQNVSISVYAQNWDNIILFSLNSQKVHHVRFKIFRHPHSCCGTKPFSKSNLHYSIFRKDYTRLVLRPTVHGHPTLF